MAAPRPQPALLPRCVTRFVCTQDRCADTCCSGWKTSVDRLTYERYQQLPPSPLQALITSSVVKEDQPAGDETFAWIRPAPGTLRCPMQRGGLCSVQRQLGEEALANGCFSFPRFTRALGEELTQGMSLSCPEAARLALLAPDAFEFEEGSVPLREGAAARVSLPPGLTDEAAGRVRVYCLQLARAADVAPWMRLAVMGLLCERLDAAISSGNAASVTGVLERFEQEAAQPGVRAALEATVASTADQARVFTSLLRTGLSAAPSPVQARVLEAVTAALGIDEHTGHVDEARAVAAYTRGLAALPRALEAAPHLLEHYVLNELFREAFPFDRASPFAHYLDIVLRFGVLRLLLAARCAGETPPDAATLVETVQVFCRRYQHDPAFSREGRAALHARGADTMAGLLPLLRP